MKINNTSFPHPVLGVGDDVTPEPGFASEPKICQNADSFLVQVDLKMENKDIFDLITQSLAQYTCEINCVDTLFRRSVFSSSPNFEIPILKNQLAGEVRFQFFITATQKITYTNRRFHPDYAGAEFQLDAGDILAWLGEFTYDVQIQYQKLRSVGSFMEICRGDIDRPQFEFNSDKIMIRLPQALYEQYRERIVGHIDFANIIHSSLVLNALIAALMNYEDYKEKLWARTLRYRIGQEDMLAPYRTTLEGANFDEISQLASTLLLDPYTRMFASLDAIVEAGEE